MKPKSPFTFAATLLLLFLLLTLPANGSAADFTYAANDNQIIITDYIGPGGTVTIPSLIDGMPVTSIGDYAFAFSRNMTSVTIPNSVTNIGRNAFYDCTSLTSIIIPNGVTIIGVETFRGCTSLVSITLPNSLTNIDFWAFYDCTSLRSVAIPNSVTIIREQAFHYCTSLTNAMIGNGVIYIERSAFAWCTSLSSVIIPHSVTSIAPGSFYNCTSLDNVSIPDSVKSIGIGAFQNSGLVSVTVPAGVTSIGDGAFQSCSNLTSVTIPNSVTNIGRNAFSTCTSLSAITVDASNNFYSSAGGVLFNKSQTTLLQFPGGKAGGYTIPDSVTNIEFQAFAYCANLASVSIPTSVSNIDVEAFSYCTSLTSLTIPTSVVGIGGYAFNNCTALTGVYFAGDRPIIDFPDPFNSAYRAIVYYLPGTSGWTSTFSGRPTALWNPEAPTTDLDFSVRAGQFGFTITGTSDITVVIEATPDLTNPVWTVISTNTINAGSSPFTDPQSKAQPVRFYRFRSP